MICRSVVIGDKFTELLGKRCFGFDTCACFDGKASHCSTLFDNALVAVLTDQTGLTCPKNISSTIGKLR